MREKKKSILSLNKVLKTWVIDDRWES